MGLFNNLSQGDGAPYKTGTDVNNVVPLRNVYGNASGSTLGQVGAAMSPASLNGTYSANPDSSDNPMQGADSAPVGAFAQPLTWLIVLALLLVGFRFIASKGGDGAQFANIKVTVWNVVLISLAAILGIAFFKVVFSKINVPGLTPLVQAV